KVRKSAGVEFWPSPTPGVTQAVGRPHPGPLPRGEGVEESHAGNNHGSSSTPRSVSSRRFHLSNDWGSDLPLPGGEGRGEGKGDVIPRHGPTHPASSTRLTPQVTNVQQRMQRPLLQRLQNRVAGGLGPVPGCAGWG